MVPNPKGGSLRWKRGVYLVTAGEPDTGRLLAITAAAIDGGAVLVQYRDKSGNDELRLRQAAALHALCRAAGVPLLVNDDVALAREVGAEGVHLGREDAAVDVARAALGPDAIIGVSCYADPTRARRLAVAGASYLAFGSMYPSTTKPGAPPADPAVFAAVANLGLPCVAIGGIDATNAPALVRSGADLLAVIGAVFDAPDPGAATRAIAAAFDHHPTRQNED